MAYLHSIGALEGAYGFDSTADLGDYPGDPAIQFKYAWDAGVPALNSAMVGAGFSNHAITNARSSTQGNATAYLWDGTTYKPECDGVIYRSAGGGSGSLRVYFPGLSDAKVGGYFTLPNRGILKDTYGEGDYIGPNHWNHGVCYWRFWYRTENMNQDYNGAAEGGARKVLFIYGNAPGGRNSGALELIINCIMSKEHIMGAYNGTTLGSQPFERTIAGQLYMQDASLCPYAGGPSYDVNGGLYDSPPCGRLTDGVWHEIVVEARTRAVAYNCTLNGLTLVDAWGTGVFLAENVGHDCYLARNDGSGHAGYGTIASRTNANQLVLESDVDTILEDADGGDYWTGLEVTISNYSNTYVQAWLNGVRMFRWPFMSAMWKRPGDESVHGNGWGQWQFQPHSTNKNASVAHSTGVVYLDDFIISNQPQRRESVPNRFEALGESLSAQQWAEITDAENFYPGPQGPDGLVHGETSGANVLAQKGQLTKSHLEFCFKAVWDTLGKRMICQSGADTPPASTQTRFISYNSIAHSFHYLPLCPDFLNNAFIGHGYGRNAAYDGRYWLAMYQGGYIVEMDLATYEYTTLPLDAGIGGSSIATAIEYFPERNSLVRFSGQDNLLRELVDGSGTWTTLQNGGMTTVGPYANFCLYDHVNHVMLFGGGNNSSNFTDAKKCWKVNAAGTVTRLADCPVMLTVTNVNGGSIPVIDPISGKLLAFDGTSIYVLDINNGPTGTWTEVAMNSGHLWQEVGWNSSGLPVYDMVACPIPEYGIIAFWSFFRWDHRSWFYVLKGGF